jgi:hypothetical protein
MSSGAALLHSNTELAAKVKPKKQRELHDVVSRQEV